MPIPFSLLISLLSIFILEGVSVFVFWGSLSLTWYISIIIINIKLYIRKLYIYKPSTSLSNASQGDVKLYSKEEVRIKHAGQGDVHYYGEGKLKNILHHGDGEVKHKMW